MEVTHYLLLAIDLCNSGCDRSDVINELEAEMIEAGDCNRVLIRDSNGKLVRPFQTDYKKTTFFYNAKKIYRRARFIGGRSLGGKAWKQKLKMNLKK